MEILFRAKTKKQDFLKETKNIKFIGNTWYVIGYEHPFRIKTYLRNAFLPDIWDIEEIENDTKAIHFSGMCDNENNPIFASLSKDGKGGDICDADNGYRECVFIWHKYAMCIDLKLLKEIKPYDMYLGDLAPQQYKYRTKVIGVQE